jgi:tetratricopeptide (TPR) repeat protein
MTRQVCLCALVAVLLSVCGCGTTKQAYIAKGNKLAAAGKYDEAILNYRAAIQKDPAYGEAFYRLGIAAMKADQVRPAYDALFRAVQLSPDNFVAKEKFADVCLSLYLADAGHSQLLYNQIDKLSHEFLKRNGASYEGLLLKGYLASTDRKPKEAIDSLRKALRVNSSNDGVATELAHLLIQDGEVSQGEQLATNLIVRKKTSYGPAYDLMYELYRNTGRAADAENVLKAKAANNPKNAGYVFELAAHYFQARNTSAMNGALQGLLDNPNDFPQARLWIGNFYLKLRDFPQAIHYYQQGADASSEAKTKVVYQIKNVLALDSAGQPGEAIRLADRLQKANPKDDALLRLNADLLLARGKQDDADTIVRDFQTLAARSPNDATVRIQLARACRMQGDLETARKELLQAIQQRRDLTDARYELAEIDLLRNRQRDAVQQAREILTAQPNDRRARLLYATGLIGSGDGETARTVLARLIQDFPQDPQPQVLLGRLALAQRSYPQAIEVLTKHRANGDAQTLAALANAYAHQRQFDQARAVLHEGLAKWPGSSILIEQLADTEALNGHYEAAVAQYQKLLARNPKSIVGRRRLAEVYELQGDHTRALAYLQEAHRLAPGDVSAAVNLADSLARAGRMQEAKAIYHDVARTNPENAPALNNVAFFLADTGGDLDEALRLARTALAKSPGQPGFADTIGYIYLKKGLLDSAIQSFSSLAHRYPAAAGFRYHLALALYQKGNKAVARKELEAALADHPSPQDTSRIRELLHEIG